MPNIDELDLTLSRARNAARAEGTQENINISTHADAIVVAGNKAGLIELARLILKVASKNGAHQDMDTSHFASSADRILTIALDSKLR